MSQISDFLPGAGGTSAAPSSGAFALAVGADVVQKFTPTAAGQYVSLYTALDAGERAGVHVFMNAGPFALAIRDSTGVVRGHLLPYDSCVVSLVDDSTAAGGWVLTGTRQVGVTASLADTTNSLGTTTRVKAITLDSARTMLLYGDTSCYAVIFNKTTASWGSAVLVRASLGSGLFDGILADTDKVLVMSCSATIGFEGVVVGASGTTVTVNTAASVVLAGNIVSFGNMVALSSAWCISYQRATDTSAIRAMSISGTTVTIGAEVVTDASGAATDFPAHLYVYSTTMVAIGVGDVDGLYARPYTVSGTTLSLGTAGTPIAASDSVAFRTLDLGSGVFAAIYAAGGTTVKGTIITLSGTTTAISAGATLFSGGTNAPATNADAILCNGKVICSYLNTTARFNTLTDSGGTASAGTAIDITGSTALPAAVSQASTTARFAASDGRVYSIDASGASPVATQALHQAGSTNIAYPAITRALGCTRSHLNLTVGSYVRALPTSGQHLASLAVGASDARVLPLDLMTSGSAGWVGSADSESWLANATCSGGIFLQRVQGAAA